jgi:serine/threonine-protein kinase
VRPSPIQAYNSGHSNQGVRGVSEQQLDAADADASEFRGGQVIGPYVLREMLGRGGMGEVWLASRADGTMNRQVALKLPHSHLLAGLLRRRFERERDILAELSHAHIAQLYDAGVADGQHPYLAMEWVEGRSITDYCREQRLTIDARLALCLQILEAIGHAHGRLIAHRDIKPSNILVTPDGRVKLLDFGIAKLLDPDREVGATALTQYGTCMATPDYAAPEQFTTDAITVAVDLYALGVVLFELLAGQRPFHGVRGRGIVPRPSALVDAAHAGSVGGLTPRQLSRALAGDLDAILAKALEPDPARRYRSAEAFAADIQRSREHLPISARRIGPATLAVKFVQRHRIGVLMTAGLALALLVGTTGVVWEAVRAEREAARATTIKDFLVGVFRASDPRIGEDQPRGEITARALLDASSQHIESAFAAQPATQIELLGVTAEIYRELDESRRSSVLYAREATLARQYFGPADVHAIDGLLGQAAVASADGDAASALRLLDQADPLIRQAKLERTAVRARWWLVRGETLLGDANQEDAAQSALASADRLFQTVAPRDPLHADALLVLGNLALQRGQFSRAAADYRGAIAAAGDNAQAEGYLLEPYAGLALALRRQGDFEGAAAAFAAGDGIAVRTFGRDSRRYWGIASDRAQFRYERGERTEALLAFEALLATLPFERTAYRSAPDALEAAEAQRKFGRCLATDGQAERAIPLLEKAQRLLQQSAASAADTVQMQFDLAKAYEAGGRSVEARATYESALKTFTAQGAPAWLQANAHERWGRFLARQNDAHGAAAEFEKALRLSGGRSTEAAVYAQAGVASIALASGDVSGALASSALAVAGMAQIEGNYDVRVRVAVWGVRARALLLAGDADAAREFAQRARDAAGREYAPDAAPIQEAERVLQEARLRQTVPAADPRPGR